MSATFRRLQYEHARAGTALSSEEGSTYRLALAILLVPPFAGFLLGELTDLVAARVASALGRLEARDDEALSRPGRLLRWFLRKIRARILLDGPTTWDRIWKTLRRDEPFVYVRGLTKNGQSVLGTMGRVSRAALSPQPRDLYIEQVLRPVRSPEGAVELRPTSSNASWMSARPVFRHPHIGDSAFAWRHARAQHSSRVSEQQSAAPPW